MMYFRIMFFKYWKLITIILVFIIFLLFYLFTNNNLNTVDIINLPETGSLSPGSIDNSFNIGNGFAPNTSQINAIAIQPDKKIIIGGSFSSFNGININNIIRLNEDGSIDNDFVIGSGFNDQVYAIKIQSDGKILVGGNFSSFNGNLSGKLVRLWPSGQYDETFNVGDGFNNGSVNSIAFQSNGKIIAGGFFTGFQNKESKRIIRLHLNGDRDLAFDIGFGFNGNVNTLAVDNNDHILVGGNYTAYNGKYRNYIIRLNPDGLVDDSFSIGTGFNLPVNSIDIEANGNIIVAGGFTSYNGRTIRGIARLSNLGVLDHSFNTGAGTNSVKSIKILRNNSILLGGLFRFYNNISTNNIARIDLNGNLDPTFNIGNGFDNGNSLGVNAIAIQQDNKLLVGGHFNTYNGNSSNRIIRIINELSVLPTNTLVPVTPTNTVIVTNTIRPTYTVAVTNTIRPTNTVAVTNTIRPTNTVVVTNTIRPTYTVTVTNTIRPTNTIAPNTIVCGPLDQFGQRGESTHDNKLHIFDFIAFRKVYQSYCSDVFSSNTAAVQAYGPCGGKNIVGGINPNRIAIEDFINLRRNYNTASCAINLTTSSNDEDLIELPQTGDEDSKNYLLLFSSLFSLSGIFACGFVYYKKI
jgi:uncharacterized delta-60 repeat protein